MTLIRADLIREEMAGLFDLPFTDLLFQAAWVRLRMPACLTGQPA